MISLELEFKQAWIGHRKFKSHLRTYLSGSNNDISTISDHLGCSLNNWLKDVAVQYTHSDNAILEASYLHEEIHYEAGRIVKMHQQNRTEEAQFRLSEIEAMDEDILAALNGVLKVLAA